MAVGSVWRDPQTKGLPAVESMRGRMGAVEDELEIVSSRGHGTIVPGTVSAAAPRLGELGEWER